MKNLKRVKGIAIIAVLVLAVLITGCDEGLNMAGDIISEPAEVDPGVGDVSPEPTVPDEEPNPVVVMGEVKDPDPEPPVTADPEADPESAIDEPNEAPIPEDSETEPEMEPEVPQEPTLLTPDPEVGITHRYLDGIPGSYNLPPTAWVLDFPGPFRRYAPPEGNPDDFVGRVCMPVAGVESDAWAEEGYAAPVSNVIVTITHGPRAGEQTLTDQGGYYLFEDVQGDEIYLRVERQWLEPKEVIVYRDHPTMLQEIGQNRVFNVAYQERDRQDNIPGTILMGIRWTDKVRFILEDEVLPHDLLCVLALYTPKTRWASGAYGGLTVSIHTIANTKWEGVLHYSTFFHEIAHARQHAVATQYGDTRWRDFVWESTPEGRAYQEAWEKDLENVPRKEWMHFDKFYESNLLENAADFCVAYWWTDAGSWHDSSITRDGGIRAKAPNRYKWAQTYLKAHP